MSRNEVNKEAPLYLDLLNYIREETGYFNYDALFVEDIKKNLITSLDDNDKKIIVAIDNGEAVGFIAGEIIKCFLPVSRINKVGYISGAYVIPSCRRKGVSKYMEKILLNFFIELGLKYVELNVLSLNYAGKASWESMGYTTFREQMRKKL